MKRLIITIILFFSFILPGCSKNEFTIPDIPEVTEKEEIVTQPEKIVVYICGEVISPGIYELTYGDRIYNLIDAAGGVTADADTTSLNLAQPLHDGQQVIVYSAVEKSVDTDLSLSQDGKVNINFASKDELMTLPGIGSSKADDILSYREQTGWFSTKEDLMNIPGIKEKMFEKIQDLIEV